MSWIDDLINSVDWQLRREERERAIRTYPAMQRQIRQLKQARDTFQTRIELAAGFDIWLERNAPNARAQLDQLNAIIDRLDADENLATAGILEAGRRAVEQNRIRPDEAPRADTGLSGGPLLLIPPAAIVAIAAIVAAAIVTMVLGWPVVIATAQGITTAFQSYWNAWTQQAQRNGQLPPVDPAAPGAGSGGTFTGELGKAAGSLLPLIALGGLAWFLLGRNRK